MGSPLSPVIANIYMEDFEAKALNSFPLTPEEWKRYVNDIFAKWRHGRVLLEDFLAHLNSLSEHIKFTMEMEEEGKLAFLDVLLTKKVDGSLGYQVYRKNTHTDRYVHANSHHHPDQKVGAIQTLSCRAKRISDIDHLEK